MEFSTLRLGNTALIEWSIFRPGSEPEPLEGKTLDLTLARVNGEKLKITEYSVADNCISFKFLGAEQKYLGQYRMTLVINKDMEDMATVDRNAFELIADSQNAELLPSDDLKIVTIQLSSELTLSRGNADVTKEAVEAVLVGNIESHNHNTQIAAALLPYAKSVDVPTKTSQLQNDSGFLTEHQDISGKLDKSVYDADKLTFATKSEVSAIDAKIGEIEVDVPIVSQTLLDTAIGPNVYNKWGEIASLKITLTPPTDSTIVNTYWIEFTSGTTATTLSLPDTIKWLGGSAPTIDSNKTYQISIQDNLAVIGGF